MKSPIKLNNSNFPKFLLNFLPNEDDPRNLLKGDRLSSKEFSRYIESIYFGGKFSKTTMPDRHVLSDDAIINLLSKKGEAIILDVGASDGSTSLDLIRKINGKFKKYYITDVSFSLHIIEENGNTYFYDPLTKECIMIVNNNLIIYHDNLSSSIIGSFAKKMIRKAPQYDSMKIKDINLCQPELQRLISENSKIRLIEWSIFDAWENDKVDIVKVANVLKTEVFSDGEIVKALANLKNILNADGYIIITRNLDLEQYSIFRNIGKKLILESEKNGGCGINYLVKEV